MKEGVEVLVAASTVIKTSRTTSQFNELEMLPVIILNSIWHSLVRKSNTRYYYKSVLSLLSGDRESPRISKKNHRRINQCSYKKCACEQKGDKGK